jgi:hypothetical protein
MREIFSILNYGAESWTLTETIQKKLEAFGIWLYREILRISWVDRVTNEAGLKSMRKKTFTRLSITKKKKTLLTDSIYISADYAIIRRYN